MLNFLQLQFRAIIQYFKTKNAVLELSLQNQLYKLMSENKNNVQESCAICAKYFEPNTRIASYKSNHYHEDCFTCSKCGKSLSDKPFVVKDPNEFDSKKPNILCNSCFEEESPKCFACNNAFEANNKMLVVNETKHFHPKCFKCAKCHTLLENESYFSTATLDKDVNTDEASPEHIRCAHCFENDNPGVVAATPDYFNSECDKCHKPFSPGTLISAYREKKFHQNCFTCSKCSKPIEDSSGFFPVNDDELWCIECYRENGPKCPQCSKSFEAEEEVLDYDGKEYHVNCFKCEKCNAVIGSDPFYLTDGKICCKKCF
ncbi:hypothetical protein GJ496_010452 [Pomphorhynchus laevis]|nr:hypothetical protein GJ496_010452 [Pomphorhynchus laevis]